MRASWKSARNHRRRGRRRARRPFIYFWLRRCNTEERATIPHVRTTHTIDCPFLPATSLCTSKRPCFSCARMRDSAENGERRRSKRSSPQRDTADLDAAHKDANSVAVFFVSPRPVRRVYHHSPSRPRVPRLARVT